MEEERKGKEEMRKVEEGEERKGGKEGRKEES